MLLDIIRVIGSERLIVRLLKQDDDGHDLPGMHLC
jgi:hypothetical protein